MLKTGTQIIYVPDHARGDITHPDCEEGFVTSEHEKWAFCRFFKMMPCNELKPVASKEMVLMKNLVKHPHRPQYIVDNLIKELHNPQG